MTASSGFVPLVTVVGFHHARGPEVETWFGVEEGCDPASDNEWPLLPFMALSDGAHTSSEDFSYFTLRHEATADRPPTSLFGISCTRQLDASQLIDRPADVTRSTVQKAVVVIADSPQAFGQVREKLSMVTKAWFAQRDFTDMDILKKFQESLITTLKDHEDDKDQYLGLSLRELIHEFKHQTLVLFKCCLLQPKMLFFGSRCERLCMMQFSLISLIPGLIRNLQDCADPELDMYRQTLVQPTSLKTSERNSLLSYMGLPLQIFGKGSLFGPYTPLQQLDILADFGTRSYIVGSTNSLLLQQKDRYSDILINLDEESVYITSTSLRAALALSVADRRWIDFLTHSVQDTWDDTNPGRPKMMGYVGSEEFIRLQFEEYLLSLISSVKYHIHLQSPQTDPRALLADVEGDPSVDFGSEWIQAWMQTENFKIFQTFTDSHLFDIVEPRHPCAGGLTMDDVQRRLAQQVAELHLDERFNTGKEVLGKHLAESREKVSSAFNNLWADIEVMREAQRKRHEELRLAAAINAGSGSGSGDPRQSLTPERGGKQFQAPDLTAAQATVTAASKTAGAYISSWANWAGEKRRGGWGRRSPSPASAPSAPAPSAPAKASTSASKANSSSLKRRSGQLSPMGDGAGGLMPLQLGRRSFEEEMFNADSEKSPVESEKSPAAELRKTREALEGKPSPVEESVSKAAQGNPREVRSPVREKKNTEKLAKVDERESEKTVPGKPETKVEAEGEESRIEAGPEAGVTNEAKAEAPVEAEAKAAAAGIET